MKSQRKTRRLPEPAGSQCPCVPRYSSPIRDDRSYRAPVDGWLPPQPPSMRHQPLPVALSVDLAPALHSPRSLKIRSTMDSILRF